jgi:hypothetical protein
MFFAVFMAVLSGLSTQELAGNDQENDQITAISVSGLKRTRPRIVEGPLQKFIGRNAAEVDINEVIAVIESTGILESISVEITDNPEDNGKTLAVTVREKWAILPVPVFSVNSSGWTVGGALMDTNAFGVKDNMMVMGSYGTGGGMANLMYNHSPNVTGDFGWNLMGMIFFQEKETMDQEEDQTLRRYNSMSVNPSAGLSYKLTEFITPSFSLSYKGVLLQDTEDPINEPEEDMHGISFSPGINIRRNTWDGIFLNEDSASFRYNYILVIDGDDVHSVSFNAALNRSIIPGFRYIAKTGMTFSTSSAVPFFESSPMNAGVHILSQKYSTLNIAGASLGLEKSLFKFSFGTVSLMAAYEAVYSDGPLLHQQFDHGPVAMLQMYLNRVAIPGVGLGGAYNVAKNSWQYAFNIGMSF